MALSTGFAYPNARTQQGGLGRGPTPFPGRPWLHRLSLSSSRIAYTSTSGWAASQAAIVLIEALQEALDYDQSRARPQFCTGLLHQFCSTISTARSTTCRMSITDYWVRLWSRFQLVTARAKSGASPSISPQSSQAIAMTGGSSPSDTANNLAQPQEGHGVAVLISRRFSGVGPGSDATLRSSSECIQKEDAAIQSARQRSPSGRRKTERRLGIGGA
jgi:hypothetical protein